MNKRKKNDFRSTIFITLFSIIVTNIIYFFILSPFLNEFGSGTHILNSFFLSIIHLNPELFMLISIFLLFIYCIIYSGSVDSSFIVKTNYFSLLIVFCSFVLISAVSIDNFYYNSLFDSFYYIRSDYNSIVELFLLFLSFFIFFFTYSYNKVIGIFCYEYYIIMLICICSFCLFVHCNNIIFMYVLIELQSIGSYILTSLHRNNRYSIEAGLKYFIIGSFSSILILFGFTFLYGFSGLVSFDDLSLYIKYLYLDNEAQLFLFNSLLFSFIFFNIGFLFKIYAAPFHFWVSDIYQGSPTSVTMFLSTVPVVSYVYVFIKLYVSIFSDFSFFYSYVLYFFSISSMLFGLFGALIQYKIKKLIAYSSISAVGYILAGLSGDSVLLVQYSILYLFVYVLNVLPIFIIILNYRINNLSCIHNIGSLSSLFYQNKWLFLYFISFFFSLAGVPPFSGFVSKLFLFSSLGYSALYILLSIGLITSIFSCYYYLRVIKIVFYDVRNTFFFSQLTYSTCYISALFFIFHLFFFFFSSFLEDICLYISICLYLG